MSPEDLDNRFDYHPPDAAAAELHAHTRTRCKALAAYLNANLPEGQEKSLAITSLEQAMFWANAAIARRQ